MLPHPKSGSFSGILESDQTSLGLFLPLPERLANQFAPMKGGKDTSPSHATFQILGDYSGPGMLSALKQVLGQFFKRQHPQMYRLDLAGLGYFDNEDATVAFVRILPSAALFDLRENLVEELLSHGFPVNLKHPEWTPHVTLDYLDPGDEWEGPIPTGRWDASWIELWGAPKVYRLISGQGLA